MLEEEILNGSLIEELTLEETAAVCLVETQWLVCRIEEGLIPGAEAGRISMASLLRARRMRDIERNFEASPELAALVADLLEEMDQLRSRLRDSEQGRPSRRA